MPQHKPKRVLASLVLATAIAGLTGCGGSLTRGQEALAVGDEAAAETHLRKALKQSATRDEAARLLSGILVKKADEFSADEPKQAEDLYREALSLDPRNEGARVGIARLLVKRGFMAEANELLAFPGCHSCGRMLAMLTHQNADAALAAGDVMGARAMYQEAFDSGKDPLDALGLVRTYLAPSAYDLDQAMAALAAAAPLIAGGQVEAETQFQALRTQVLEGAAAAKDNEKIEQIFQIKTYTLQDEPEFDLRFRISQAQFRSGDSDPAIERITDLLTNYSQYLDPTQREVMNAALVVMYGARAAHFLQIGDPVGAAKDIGAGLKIDPSNSRLKLQQVLAIAANRLPLAFTTLEGVPKSSSKSEVEAILHALDCLEQLDAGKMTKVYEALAKAQRLGPDVPEVYLARAYVLAKSRNEDLTKADDIRDARKLAGFDYPQGRINQYAGALASLDRARDGVKKQGNLHPFRGPGFDTRAKALEDEIKAFYPHEVEWYSGEGGMIELLSEETKQTAEYAGPRWLKGTAIASPGFPAEIPVKVPGLVYLTYEGKSLGIVSEANTHIKVKL